MAWLFQLLRIAVSAIFLLGASSLGEAGASPASPVSGNIKITFGFHRLETSSGGGAGIQGTGPGGTVIHVGPSGVSGSARVYAGESQRRTRQTGTSFILVQDGAEAWVTVAEQAPEIVWYEAYARRHGYIQAGVIFRQVGTSFAVRPMVLPDRRIRLRIVPQVAYRTDGPEGLIEVVEAATEVVVASGQSLTIGGSSGSNEVVRQVLLGYARVNRTGDVTLVVTAETMP
jgi:type II secretory pathway component GspD/PulD (secretin)